MKLKCNSEKHCYPFYVSSQVNNRTGFIIQRKNIKVTWIGSQFCFLISGQNISTCTLVYPHIKYNYFTWIEE